MTVANCWHCMLGEITLNWRPSLKYSGWFVGYVHRAKTCVIKPLPRGRWQGTVFLPMIDGCPDEEHADRAEAERWCLDTVRLWFSQLDHE